MFIKNIVLIVLFDTGKLFLNLVWIKFMLIGVPFLKAVFLLFVNEISLLLIKFEPIVFKQLTKKLKNS